MFNLDLSKLHIPYKYDQRAAGRKLQAIAKYVFIAAGLIAVIGCYFLLFNEGKINDWKWTLGFGATSVIIIIRIAKYIKIAKLLYIIIWILMFISFGVTVNQGISKPEWGIVITGAAGLVFFIGVFMYIKGDVFLKSYMQEYPFQKM